MGPSHKTLIFLTQNHGVRTKIALLIMYCAFGQTDVIPVDSHVQWCAISLDWLLDYLQCTRNSKDLFGKVDTTEFLATHEYGIASFGQLLSNQEKKLVRFTNCYNECNHFYTTTSSALFDLRIPTNNPLVHHHGVIITKSHLLEVFHPSIAQGFPPLQIHTFSFFLNLFVIFIILFVVEILYSLKKFSHCNWGGRNR